MRRLEDIIITNSVIISKIKKQNEKNHRYLSVIKNASENLLIIIDDILDLSKMEAGKMQLEKIPFLIREVIGSVADTLQLKAEEKGLKFIVDLDANIPSVLCGDPARLTQVLLNLLGNAVKFTERGSVTLEVSSQKSERSNESSSAALLTFIISDTGIGIEKEKLNSIFESFTQAHTGEARKYGGTGLGLTISKSLVELFGGKLEAESEAGAGSVFSFTVPFMISSEESFEEYHLKKAGYSADDLFGLKILLAEDNEHNQLVAVDTLKKLIEDVVIDVAKNGNEVLEALGRQQASGASQYDLILMDVQMPELDGYETTRQIRNPQSAIHNHSIPIIALTASVVRSDLKKCIDAGMNSYIPKPFVREDLVKEIGKVLQRNTSQKQLLSSEASVKKESLTGITSNYRNFSIAEGNLQQQEITDLTSVINLYGDDPLKLKEYLLQFLELVPARIKILKTAIETNNIGDLRLAAHKLKPQLGFFGMKKEELIANTIEIKAMEIPAHELQLLIAQLEEGCNLAAGEINVELERIS